MTSFNNFPINGVTISNLPTEITPQLTDKVAVVQSGVTYMTTWSAIQSLFENNYNSVSNVVAFSSAVSLSSGVPINLTSISLSAANWLVFANLYFTSSSGTALITGWTSQISDTKPDQSIIAQATSGSTVAASLTIPQLIYPLSTNETVYLTAQAIFGAGAVTVCGGIYALQI